MKTEELRSTLRKILIDFENADVGIKDSINDILNLFGELRDYPVYDEQYLDECIKKATPGLSKIKNVDKALDEIRGIEPNDWDMILSKWDNEVTF